MVMVFKSLVEIMASIRSILLLLLLIINLNLYSQSLTEIDSCNYYSKIFKDTCNFKNGLISKSFDYLERNCIQIGCKESCVIELLGNNNFRDGVIYRRYKKDERINTKPSFEYDYYISYFIWMGCDEFCNLDYFPSTKVLLFFKKNKLVKISTKDFG